MFQKGNKHGTKSKRGENAISKERRNFLNEVCKESWTVTDVKVALKKVQQESPKDWLYLLLQFSDKLMSKLGTVDVTHDMSDETVTKVNKIIKVIMTGGDND